MKTFLNYHQKKPNSSLAPSPEATTDESPSEAWLSFTKDRRKKPMSTSRSSST